MLTLIPLHTDDLIKQDKHVN